jgi:hypothetical protein
MSQPATEKRQRSPAQVAAFEKAKATREANLRKKWEEEQAATAAASAAVTTDDTAADVEDVQDTADEEQVTEPPQQPPQQQPARKQQQQAAVVELSVPAQQYEDYIELDTDDLFAQLSQYKHDIAELKGHVTSLHENHQKMQSSYNTTVPYNFFV